MHDHFSFNSISPDHALVLEKIKWAETVTMDLEAIEFWQQRDNSHFDPFKKRLKFLE